MTRKTADYYEVLVGGYLILLAVCDSLLQTALGLFGWLLILDAIIRPCKNYLRAIAYGFKR